MRILQIEDNPADLDLTRRLLSRKAPEIHLEQADTQSAALQRLQSSEDLDLVMIDLKLPDGSGMDILAWIRDRQLPLAVVMLTGCGDQEAAIAALRAGADDYLVKGPDTLDRLPAVLANARRRFAEASARRTRIIRVLYAEHNAADIDPTRRHLARYAPHIRLSLAQNVDQVLAQMPARPDLPADYDLVLLDYRLPGLDALEAVKRLRVERALDIPIVLVTGQGSEEVAARSIHLGVTDYIVKNAGYLHKLPATIEKVVSQTLLTRERANLREASQRLEMVLAASPVILYTRRRDQEEMPIVWVSENLARLLGHQASQALQPGWWLSHLHPEDRDRVVMQLATLDSRDTLVQDYRFLDGRGRVRWIQDEQRLEQGPGGSSQVATGAWRDVTDAKLAELTQQTRLEVLGSLIEGRPLATILEIIETRLEAIYPDTQVSIRLLDDDPRKGAGLARRWLGEPGGSPAQDEQPTPPQDPEAGRAGSAARIQDAPGTRTAEDPGLSVPFHDGAGVTLGHLVVRHQDSQALPPEETGRIAELACLAGLAVAYVRAETSLRQAATVFESTREGVIITDLSTRILSANRAYTEITGYSAEEVGGRKPGMMQSGRQDRSFYQALWASVTTTGHWQGEIWNRRKNGEIYPQLLSISAVYDSQGAATHYVGVMADISQLKQSEARLEHLVHYDPLTNLPNRRLVQSRLEHALKHAERQGRRLGVLFLDLDRFKTVNDSLGHPVGDELLQALTDRLRKRLREDDTLGRLGGDEFLILLEDLDRPEEAASVAQTMLALLEQPLALPSGHELYVSVSIGISLYPSDGCSVAELIKHADVAMYEAKEQGRNTYRFYRPTLTDAANERLKLEAQLRRALTSNELTLHYQPQFDSLSGRLIGCEALVRWQAPGKGIVPPDRFIPLVEETGLIVPLGEWVLRAACIQARTWVQNDFPDLVIAVNLSGRQLQRPDLVERLAAVLKETGLPPEHLKLELTESMIMLQGESVDRRLHALKSLGLRLSVDDFGTGYSSLASLKRLPIDELKIDRSFVRDIPHDQNDVEIAATIIAMARNLRLHVIAEGVETHEQMELLASQGCDACQGYLLGRPLPAEEFARSVRDAR